MSEGQELVVAKTNVPLERIDWDAADTRKLLINTVAKGATHEEYAMFREMCKGTGLNPFKREIWFIKTKGGVQMMTGVNGFHEIANKHPQYDGLEIVYGPEIQVELPKEVKGITSIYTFEWIECRVYRKDRTHPMVWRAFWREYAQDLVSFRGHLTNWAKMPSVMLAKCAESMALRKAFPQELNGLYSAEEMGDAYSLSAVNANGGNTALQEKYAAVKADTIEVEAVEEEVDELTQEEPELEEWEAVAMAELRCEEEDV